MPAGFEVGLQAVDVELTAIHRAVLHPRIEAFDFVAKAKFKIREFTATINEKCILAVGWLFVGGCFTDDRSLINSPELVVPFPLAKSLPVEQRFKTLIVNRPFDSRRF